MDELYEYFEAVALTYDPPLTALSPEPFMPGLAGWRRNPKNAQNAVNKHIVWSVLVAKKKYERFMEMALLEKKKQEESDD